MLKDAVEAGLPLIVIAARDMINFETVVAHITGKPPLTYDGKDPAKSSLYYMNLKGKKAEGLKAIYSAMAAAGSTLILVNIDKVPDEAFDAGDLETPKELVRKVLVKAFKGSGDKETSEKFVEGLMPALGGLTLKEVSEVLRLTQVRQQTINAEAVTKTRSLLVPNLSGLTQINTDLPVYLPNPVWDAFVEENKAFFVNETIDPRLVPRGVLLDGDPGTGKTQGAKHLARRWGVPLYRMDATFQSKWVGESEGNIQRILNQAAQEAPCILLLDEVEKIFSKGSVSGSGGGSGVTSKAMSLLLWFMQENPARVFVIMTCNNKSVIPPELYREGRVAGTITFEGLKLEDAYTLADAIIASFKLTLDKDAKEAFVTDVKKGIHALYGQSNKVAHSAINEAVNRAIKALIMKQQAAA